MRIFGYKSWLDAHVATTLGWLDAHVATTLGCRGGVPQSGRQLAGPRYASVVRRMRQVSHAYNV